MNTVHNRPTISAASSLKQLAFMFQMIWWQNSCEILAVSKMNRATYPNKLSINKAFKDGRILTEVIITKGLDDLRDEEERQIHRMLFEYPVGIL